jgi:hypothetical protein
MCRVNPKGVGFTRIRAPEVEPSMGPNPVKPTPEGFMRCKDCCSFVYFQFFPIIPGVTREKNNCGCLKKQNACLCRHSVFPNTFGFFTLYNGICKYTKKK